MKKYKAYDIEWETDGEVVELPCEVEFEIEDGIEPFEEGANIISDQYGWLIRSLEIEEIS